LGDEPLAKDLGIEIVTQLGCALIRLHLYKGEAPRTSELYAPFSASSLREAARVLNQAAREQRLLVIAIFGAVDVVIDPFQYAVANPTSRIRRAKK
jgi:hypothetical protein